MIFGPLSKCTGNALFSRVLEHRIPTGDVVLLYIISCFFTYYDEKWNTNLIYPLSNISSIFLNKSGISSHNVFHTISKSTLS